MKFIIIPVLQQPRSRTHHVYSESDVYDELWRVSSFVVTFQLPQVHLFISKLVTFLSTWSLPRPRLLDVVSYKKCIFILQCDFSFL